jgi:hypothetical protein
VEDFSKICGLLRISELYEPYDQGMNISWSLKLSWSISNYNYDYLCKSESIFGTTTV